MTAVFSLNLDGVNVEERVITASTLDLVQKLSGRFSRQATIERPNQKTHNRVNSRINPFETVEPEEVPLAESRILLEYARNLFHPHFAAVKKLYDNYYVKSQIGSRGASGGAVFLLENRFTGDMLALKAFLPNAETFDERIDLKLDFTRELHTLEHLTYGSEKNRFVEFKDLGGAKYEAGYPKRFEKRNFPRSPNTVLYFIMEYMSGGSLAERINPLDERMELSFEQKLRIITQTAEGLAEAHAMRYVHRDIKPENILLTRDLDVKIGDFGIASFARAHKIQTHSNREGHKIGGTYLYASPEQLKEMLYFVETGDRVPNFKPDYPTDIYSFGVLGYELMTGKKPKEIVYRTPQRILKDLVANPIRKEDLSSSGDSDIDRVIRKCLRLNGQYPSMNDVVEDLRKVSPN